MAFDPEASPEMPSPASADAERDRLVRLCARLTGDPVAAEDLAQETLYEAWRSEAKLRDPAKRAQWLSGIARNVCLRWRRTRATESTRRALWIPEDGLDNLPMPSATEPDLELELERDELAELLDRALALLPPVTRDVLIGHYIHEAPSAETARRLGLNEGAVEKRLQRGRLALRRVLTTELADEAAAYGLSPASNDDWRETRIWCMGCGERKLVGRFTPEGHLELDCIGCRCVQRWNHSRSMVVRSNWYLTDAAGTSVLASDLRAGIKGFKPALNRLEASLYEALKGGLNGQHVRCPVCAIQAPLYVASEEETVGEYFVGADCPRCKVPLHHSSYLSLVLATPEGQRFWREHPRIRSLPSHLIEAGAVPAVVVGYESITGSARLEGIFTRHTAELIAVHGAPEP